MPIDTTAMHQTCYSYTARQIGIMLGLRPTPDEWVVVEVDQETVDVMIRKNVTPRKVPDHD